MEELKDALDYSRQASTVMEMKTIVVGGIEYVHEDAPWPMYEALLH